MARLLLEKHQVEQSVEGIYLNIYFDSASVESAVQFVHIPMFSMHKQSDTHQGP